MKFFKAIGKNFKILFRSKTSLLALILGPLFIVFMVGLAFNSSSSMDISLGYTSQDNTTLTQEFIDALSENSYTISFFNSKNICVDQLKQGLVHACLIFPEDFKIEEGNSKEITFVVDKSRMNLVYAIIDGVSEQIGLQSDQLSQSLTDVLINTLDSTSSNIDSNLASLVSVQNRLSNSIDNADTINNNLGNMDLEMGTVDTDFMTDFENLHGYTENINEEINDYESNSSLKSFVNDEYDDSVSFLASLETKLNSTSSGLNDLANRLSDAEDLTEESQNSISSLQEDINSISEDISIVRSDLESSSYNINNIHITSSNQIVNPITTKIETITTDDNQLSVLFPYALILIIMFIAMLLASTLVVIEKKSRAAFRVFTTPTRDEFYLFSTFLTAFIILSAQISLILLLSKYFFIDMITANIGINILILSLASAFFIILGMAIGYIFSSQQSTNMASISIAAIFLFISNLILPLETVSKHLQAISQFNPFVLTSEMLRKSFLFESSIQSLATQFLILAAYILGMFILIVFIQKLAKNMYFSKRKSNKIKNNINDSYLFISGRKILSEHDFIISINRLSEEEFKVFSKNNKKELKHFLNKVISRKNISRKIPKISKKELLSLFAKIHEKRYHQLKIHQEELMKKNNKSSKK